MSESAPETKRRTVASRPSTPLSEEIVDAGSALAGRGVTIARTVAETGLKVSDAVVLGSLDAAEEWASATPVAGLAVPPVKVARETWSATRDGIRELVLAV